MAQPRGPLDGVKVVACSTAQAGTVPYVLMADLGAEVIKIEVPGVGDNSRQSGQIPGFPSTYFETNNRGVKSLTLNLRAPEGKEILYQVVKEADVFGQNFRPGAAEKNGFGYEDLKKVNPRIVYVSVSGYGPLGPHAMLPGTDSMAQALGGVAEAFSTPGQAMKTGIVSVADETCAILAFGLMGWTLTTTMWKEKDPVTGQARITGTAKRPGISASFNDKNGKPFVFQMGGEKWKPAMTALGFHEEMEQRGFGDLGVAVTSEEKRSLMLETLDELFAADTRDKWVEILRDNDIVAAPINTLLEASNDPDVLANEYVTEVEYPKYGKKLKVHGSPWRFSETPVKIGIAPELGEHNVPILTSLGYNEAEIQELREKKII
jgi:crotonobetainyl-CoA:carnitine CoA-transferase CaiB-like acyl-CoA transferase